MESLQSLFTQIKQTFSKIFRGKRARFDDTQANAHYNLAHKYMENKQFDQAIEEFNKTLSFNGFYTDALVNLGIIYYHKGLYKESFKRIKSAYSINKKNSRVLYWLGRLYFEKNKYKQTEKYLLKAIELKPDFLEANYYLGLTYNQINNYNLAIEYLRKVLKFDREWSDGYYHLGIAYFKNAEFDKAIEMLESAIKFGINDVEVYLYLSNAYYNNNDIDTALKQAKEGILIDNSNSELHHLLSKIYKEKGLTDSSLEEQVKAINLDPDSMLKKIHEDPQNTDNNSIPKFLSITLQIRNFLDIITSYIRELTIIYGLLTHKRPKSAVIEIINLPFKSKLLGFKILKAEKELKKSNYRETEKLLNQVIETYPELLNPYLLLTECFITQGKYNESIKTLTDATSHIPENIDIYYKLATLYAGINNHTKAIGLLEKVISNKNLPERLKLSYYLLSEMYIITNQIDKAVATLKKSKLHTGESEIYGTLGHRLILKKSTKDTLLKGLELAKRGYELDQSEIKNLEVIGISNYKLGNIDEALIWLNKIQYPTAEIRYYLNQIKEIKPNDDNK